MKDNVLSMSQHLAESQNRQLEMQALIDDFAKGKITKKKFLKLMGHKDGKL